MDTDRTIISIATLDERVVATFALFLHRPATAEDVEDWQIVSDFLPHAETRANLGLSRIQICKVIERRFPFRRPKKPKRDPRPYCVLKIQG